MNDRTRGAAALGMDVKEGFIDKQGKVHSRSVMKTDIRESKAMLQALLARDPEAQTVIAEGVDDLSDLDRLFLTSTCSAHIIVHVIARMCGGEREAAHQGLDALVGTMREHIDELCTFTVTMTAPKHEPR